MRIREEGGDTQISTTTGQGVDRPLLGRLVPLLEDPSAGVRDFIYRVAGLIESEIFSEDIQRVLIGFGVKLKLCLGVLILRAGH